MIRTTRSTLTALALATGTVLWIAGAQAAGVTPAKYVEGRITALNIHQGTLTLDGTKSYVASTRSLLWDMRVGDLVDVGFVESAGGAPNSAVIVRWQTGTARAGGQGS